jgi:glycosyltransferase involved in cell wall biosynthesis
MRILVVSNMYPDEQHPYYGVFVKRFCEQLQMLHLDFDLSVLLKKDSAAAKLIAYGAFHLKTFYRILVHNYDLIYIHYPSYSAMGVLWASKFKNVRVYTNLHGSDVVPENKKHEKMQKYTREALQRSEKVIVPSEYFRALVADKYQFKKERIFVYPSGGIDPKVFFQKGAQGQGNGDGSEKAVTFGMAGRISRGKGWDTFVEAAAILTQRQIKAKFVIIGTGAEDTLLEQKIQEHNLERVITWKRKLVGQEELRDFYNSLDYFVFPTKREGESLGLVAVEAMACGTPVIANDFAAPKYYVQDGINGYKYKTHDPAALAEIMEKAVLEPEAIQTMREGALRTAETFSTEHVKERLGEILLEAQ